MYTNYQTHSAQHTDYSEPAALQDLLHAINEAVEYSCNRLELYGSDLSSFTINIHGKSIAFIVGGPQIHALHEFIETIAAENLYAVDFDNMTVEE